MAETSSIIFVTNILQTQIASWEFSTELTKLYGKLGVRRTEDFEEKIREIRESENARQETSDFS